MEVSSPDSPKGGRSAEKPGQLALLDIYMPGMGGMALAECISRDPAFRSIILIALSSVDRVPEENGASNQTVPYLVEKTHSAHC